MSTPWYCTREDVLSALDFGETTRGARQIDRLIAASSRSIEGQLHRVFYPTIETRTFDWPDRFSSAPSWEIWLGENELANASALVSGGTTISAADYLLRPNSGPPYDTIQIDQGTNASFEAAGSTWQDSIAITGTWIGCPADTDAAGTLSGTIDADDWPNVTDSSLVGVGSVLKVESEYMIVTGKLWIDTTQNIGADLAATSAADTVAVSTGTSFATGEVIIVGSERMLIEDVVGNNLTVRRGYDGSTLAAHTNGADIYAPRSLKVERGALGSTAASHADATAVYTHRVPFLIRELAIAETLVGLARESSGYARTIGNGDQIRGAPVRDLTDLRAAAYAAHGRKGRHLAI